MSEETVGDAAAAQPAHAVEEKKEAEVAPDEHLKEHEGATKFYVVFNKKSIPFFFNLVCSFILPLSFHMFFLW